jgi:hypothetical protein
MFCQITFFNLPFWTVFYHLHPTAPLFEEQGYIVFFTLLLDIFDPYNFHGRALGPDSPPMITRGLRHDYYLSDRASIPIVSFLMKR